MPVQLNHTIVAASDRRRSADFLADLLGLAAPSFVGPFAEVRLANGVNLDFMDDPEVHPRHYAFLVTEEEFDQIFGRIRERGCRTGPTPSSGTPGRSITTTAAGASTGTTRTVTCSKSSPARTAAESSR